MRVLTRRAVLLAPSAVALLGGAVVLTLSQRWRQQASDGFGDSNPLLGRALPAFSLAGLQGGQGFSRSDVAAAGRPVLLNFFASWCVPCQQEMPELAALARRGLDIWGIAYQDHPQDTALFLRQMHDPYQRIGCDADGRVGDAFSVIGVPESFLVDRGGVVRWSWAGKLGADVVRQDLAPLVGSLRGP